MDFSFRNKNKKNTCSGFPNKNTPAIHPPRNFSLIPFHFQWVGQWPCKYSFSHRTPASDHQRFEAWSVVPCIPQPPCEKTDGWRKRQKLKMMDSTVRSTVLLENTRGRLQPWAVPQKSRSGGYLGLPLNWLVPWSLATRKTHGRHRGSWQPQCDVTFRKRPKVHQSKTCKKLMVFTREFLVILEMWHHF